MTPRPESDSFQTKWYNTPNLTYNAKTFFEKIRVAAVLSSKKIAATPIAPHFENTSCLQGLPQVILPWNFKNPQTKQKTMQSSKQQQQEKHTKNQPKPGANYYGKKKKEERRDLGSF